MLTRSYRRVGSECFEKFSSLLRIESADFGDGFFAGIPHSLDASEFLNQPASFNRPNPGHFQQLGSNSPHSPALAIVGNRKAVRFVSKLLKHSERR